MGVVHLVKPSIRAARVVVSRLLGEMLSAPMASSLHFKAS